MPFTGQKPASVYWLYEKQSSGCANSMVLEDEYKQESLQKKILSEKVIKKDVVSENLESRTKYTFGPQIHLLCENLGA